MDPSELYTVWAPRVTVAAVIERDGRFLIIEEETDKGLRLNQPAGHLEAGESLAQAACRETLEETAHPFLPEGLLGTYLWRPGGEAAPTYLRFAFVGAAGDPVPGRSLDEGIRRAFWIDADELRARQAEHRSPLVMRCVDDYLRARASGRPWLALDALYTHPAILDKHHG
ncbi:NUDIX hydrolase [Pigmentiphaga sp.]|uniref:NUDIX hydrolase n=1 Tax=Pigmentiphaga sp. TaxID=1977564 RepID=UPI0025F01E58|nr:NUDIX hydrolase [Pigmentiphaga sp.]MBX6319496.1 NUDIX hydrolase [Pigmentiphaga sp.]